MAIDSVTSLHPLCNPQLVGWKSKRYRDTQRVTVIGRVTSTFLVKVIEGHRSANRRNVTVVYDELRMINPCLTRHNIRFLANRSISVHSIAHGAWCRDNVQTEENWFSYAKHLTGAKTKVAAVTTARGHIAATLLRISLSMLRDVDCR